MRREGGYLFLLGFFSLYDAIHGWMTRWMDGKASFRPRHPLLYVIIGVVAKKKKKEEKMKKKKKEGGW
jgi:hypothetical protein